jgi:hypothetical protein
MIAAKRNNPRRASCCAFFELPRSGRAGRRPATYLGPPPFDPHRVKFGGFADPVDDVEALALDISAIDRRSQPGEVVPHDAAIDHPTGARLVAADDECRRQVEDDRHRRKADGAGTPQQCPPRVGLDIRRVNHGQPSVAQPDRELAIE